ncbi:MAG TPA: hypothetical protein VF604_13020 [Pyrinomonadaceae bacterium]|jgi:hypothetical protein
MPFPRKEPEVDALLQLWHERMPDHQTRYTLTAAQLAQVLDDALVYRHMLNATNLLDEDVKEFYTYKKNIMKGDPNVEAGDYPKIEMPSLPTLTNPPRAGIEKRNQELYNFLKAHPNRTAESLADLGIGEAGGDPVSPEDLKPALKAQARIDDKIEIAFNKQGQSAVRIQRETGADKWTNAGEPTSSPFVDETPSPDGKPEKRRYRAVYLAKNQPVGQYSDIVSVVTTP